MGCQSEVFIGDDLVFSITTHDPDTGVLTDADAAPSYRIYEDETAVPILTGNMAALDAGNTTGFYTELIACTEGNGFEDGRSYTIYIEATVDGDTGGICFGFRALTPMPEAVWSYSPRTLTQTAAEVAAALEGGDITIHRGDTLSVSLTDLGSLASYVSLDWTVKRRQSDADADAIIRIRLNVTGLDDGLIRLNGEATTGREANGSITIDDAAAGDITVALEAEETDDLLPQRLLYYDVQMITAGGVQTLTYGSATVTADVTRAVS